MNSTLTKLYVKFMGLMHREEGQDLVEYALLCCLISLSLILSINGIAAAVDGVFTKISGSLA